MVQAEAHGTLRHLPPRKIIMKFPIGVMRHLGDQAITSGISDGEMTFSTVKYGLKIKKTLSGLY